MNFFELAQKRYSARNFTDKIVAETDLRAILEAGRIAPTAANKQPQRLFVVQSKQGLNKLSKAAKFYNAPVVIIVCADTECVWRRNHDGKDTCDIDASIVTDHMMLQATALGLDTLWMTWFEPKILREEFAIPSSLVPVNLLAIGYNGKTPASPTRHDQTRVQLEQTVFYR